MCLSDRFMDNTASFLGVGLTLIICQNVTHANTAIFLGMSLQNYILNASKLGNRLLAIQLTSRGREDQVCSSVFI